MPKALLWFLELLPAIITGLVLYYWQRQQKKRDAEAHEIASFQRSGTRVGRGNAVGGACPAQVIKCGGMKIRKAGEDFYFLQELAKTSGVGVIEKKLVFPSPRISERTPFGTGQAVKDIIAGKNLSEVSDEAFDRLEKVLKAVVFENLDSDTPMLPENTFFEAERFFKVWSGIRRNTPPGKLCDAFHIWFDGLKTLRFLHWCDNHI